MDIKCSERELFILKQIADAAEELGVETYLIGGFVRDKILGRLTKDADIVCAGDGIELAKAVAKKFKPVPHVNYFKSFGTAHIKVDFSTLSTSSPEEVYDIEFVGARKESYRSAFTQAGCGTRYAGRRPKEKRFYHKCFSDQFK